MKRGDWIKLHSLEKVKATGEVFGATKAEDAKKHGVYQEKNKYGPTLVILGAGFIIPGVEKNLLVMKVGDRKSFDVLPKDAFGMKKRELLRVVSYQKFVEKKIAPFPGMPIEIDNRHCKVVSVSGGRVTVDYNHPMAGKVLSYDVEITSEVRAPKERVEALLEYYRVKAEVSVANKKAVITLDDPSNKFIDKLVTETLKKWCDGVDEVEFKSKEKPKAPTDNKPHAKA
jgi:FKBP-type peptidyl-prolyl cis-trans isomerase 2